MEYEINPIAAIYRTDGTELMQCKFISRTRQEVRLSLSLAEFLRLSNLHERVLLVLSSPNLGLLPYICTIQADSISATNAETEQNMELVFQIQETKDVIQRRKNQKVKTDVAVDILLIAPQEGYCKGKIEDISASGVCLVTEASLPLSQRFQCLFPETDIPLPLTGEIIHQYADGKWKRYGCTLEEMPAVHKKLLQQYLLQTRIKNLSQPKDTTE